MTHLSWNVSKPPNSLVTELERLQRDWGPHCNHHPIGHLAFASLYSQVQLISFAQDQTQETVVEQIVQLFRQFVQNCVSKNENQSPLAFSHLIRSLNELTQSNQSLSSRYLAKYTELIHRTLQKAILIGKMTDDKALSSWSSVRSQIPSLHATTPTYGTTLPKIIAAKFNDLEIFLELVLSAAKTLPSEEERSRLNQNGHVIRELIGQIKQEINAKEGLHLSLETLQKVSIGIQPSEGRVLNEFESILNQIGESVLSLFCEYLKQTLNHTKSDLKHLVSNSSLDIKSAPPKSEISENGISLDLKFSTIFFENYGMIRSIVSPSNTVIEILYCSLMKKMTQLLEKYKFLPSIETCKTELAMFFIEHLVYLQVHQLYPSDMMSLLNIQYDHDTFKTRLEAWLCNFKSKLAKRNREIVTEIDRTITPTIDLIVTLLSQGQIDQLYGSVAATLDRYPSTFESPEDSKEAIRSNLKALWEGFRKGMALFKQSGGDYSLEDDFWETAQLLTEFLNSEASSSERPLLLALRSFSREDKQALSKYEGYRSEPNKLINDSERIAKLITQPHHHFLSQKFIKLILEVIFQQRKKPFFDFETSLNRATTNSLQILECLPTLSSVRGIWTQQFAEGVFNLSPLWISRQTSLLTEIEAFVNSDRFTLLEKLIVLDLKTSELTYLGLDQWFRYFADFLGPLPTHLLIDQLQLLKELHTAALDYFQSQIREAELAELGIWQQRGHPFAQAFMVLNSYLLNLYPHVALLSDLSVLNAEENAPRLEKCILAETTLLYMPPEYNKLFSLEKRFKSLISDEIKKRKNERKAASFFPSKASSPPPASHSEVPLQTGSLKEEEIPAQGGGTSHKVKSKTRAPHALQLQQQQQEQLSDEDEIDLPEEVEETVAALKIETNHRRFVQTLKQLGFVVGKSDDNSTSSKVELGKGSHDGYFDAVTKEWVIVPLHLEKPGLRHAKYKQVLAILQEREKILKHRNSNNN